MMDRRRFVGLVGAAGLSSWTDSLAQAQSAPLLGGGSSWPNRAVRLWVPFAPAGGVDMAGRLIGMRLSEIWGQQVVIENRGGAGGNIAAEIVARSPPDGYTMFICSVGHAINKHLFGTLSYDPIGDFAPVSLLCNYPNVMVVPMSSPVKTAMEFISYAKANPGRTFASSSTGTSTHLAGELFKRVAGVDMTHVPYRGAGPAIQDLIPGRVDVMFSTASAAMPQIEAGTLRGLAVTSMSRLKSAPNLPTLDELGLKGFDVTSWFAFLVPAKTPSDIIQKMHADTIRVLREPGIADKFDSWGASVIASTPEALATHIKVEMDKWGPVIRDAGIKAGN